MNHIYQLVMIRTILDGGGATTKRQIAAAISAADLSQLEYYEAVVAKYPGPVLRKRGIVAYDGGVYRLADWYRRLDEWERAELTAVCNQRVAAFVAKRQERIWTHRGANPAPLPGSLRWQVISRAHGRCEACGIGSDERLLEADHVVPRSWGGTNDLSNLQALCTLCNQQKSDREAVDFREAKEAHWKQCDSCELCSGPTFRTFENRLARVLDLPQGPVVVPRRHGIAYLALWQPEVNALRELELALAELIPEATDMTAGMFRTGDGPEGHLAITLAPPGGRRTGPGLTNGVEL